MDVHAYPWASGYRVARKKRLIQEFNLEVLDSSVQYPMDYPVGMVSQLALYDEKVRTFQAGFHCQARCTRLPLERCASSGMTALLNCWLIVLLSLEIPGHLRCTRNVDIEESERDAPWPQC